MNYKRKSPFRYTFSEPITVYFKIVNINGKRIESSEGTATMIDLSPKGMKLKSSLDLQNINHKTILLSIRFTIDTIEQIVLGRIVWKKQGAGFYHYGIELLVDDAVSQTIIEELKLYVRNHEEGKGVGQN